ncbi:DNA recombination and repair protein Rad51-like [Trypanosoma melophagium]|uniref:DNA recombination and repair protein Rad51-like n=1 Tax=Trypanosoma melophagium TaxID=715481 RepID=UPI00351A9939|nr:DNA recombination and repair protein Rad51-like [Trypanosoma melophagium]
MYSKGNNTAETEDDEDLIKSPCATTDVKVLEDPSLEQEECLFFMLQKLKGMTKYNTDSQLSRVLLESPCVIAHQVDVSLNDVNMLFQYISAGVINSSENALTPISVSESLTQRYRHVIATGHESLDDALKGGVGCGLVTEITGAMGSGKTAFALHLALHSASYVKFDPRKSRTLWITTDESAFPAMAAMTLLQQHHMCGDLGEDSEDALSDVAVSIQATLAQLRSYIPVIRQYFSHYVNVRLVVIDNFSIMVRREFPGVDEEILERHESVAEIMRLLKGIAREFGVAVVVATVSGVELGHSFLHAVNTRLRFTQCFLDRRGIMGIQGSKGSLTHVMEVTKSSIVAPLRFECEFDGMCLKCVRLLNARELMMFEDTAVFGMDPFGHVVVPTFVYS